MVLENRNHIEQAFGVHRGAELDGFVLQQAHVVEEDLQDFLIPVGALVLYGLILPERYLSDCDKLTSIKIILQY